MNFLQWQIVHSFLQWRVVFTCQGGVYDTLFTLKAPITSAAEDIYKYFFIVFQRK